MDAGTTTKVPQPRDGRAELAALALAIAGHVDDRQEAAALSPPPPPPSRTGRRAAPVLAGIVLVGLVLVVTSVWALLPHHHPAPQHSAASRASAPRPAPESTSPAAALGSAAAKRLGRDGRPVSVFGCQAAYDADAATSSAALPDRRTPSPAYDDYLRACLSGMS